MINLKQISNAAKAQAYPVLLDLIYQYATQSSEPEINIEEPYIQCWIEVDGTSALVHLLVLDVDGMDIKEQPDLCDLVTKLDQYLYECEVDAAEQLRDEDSMMWG